MPYLAGDLISAAIAAGACAYAWILARRARHGRCPVCKRTRAERLTGLADELERIGDPSPPDPGPWRA